MDNIVKISQEIELIKNRNQRVEKDKQWETSVFRKIVVSVLTYFVVVSFFLIAKLPNPFINAVVPSVAFMVSTLSLPIFRKIWEKTQNRLK